MKKEEYKGFILKPDSQWGLCNIYEGLSFITSCPDLESAREYVDVLIWSRENIPF